MQFEKRGEKMLEFEFNGHKSSEFGVIISEIQENDTMLSRNIILGQKNKYHDCENNFGTTYDSNYSFNIKLLKNPCKILHADISKQITNVINGEASVEQGLLIFDHGNLLPNISIEKNNANTDERYLDFPDEYYKDLDHNIFSLDGTDYFTSNDVRKINAWLTSPQFPRLFRFLQNGYFKEDIEYFVTVTSIETENIGKPYSLSFTITCDSPYGYTPEIVKEFNISVIDRDSVESFFNNTDCREEYIYPLIYINPYDDGKLIIKNRSDQNKTLTISNLKKNNSFYIDCSKYKIYKKQENGEKIPIPFSQFSLTPNMYWPRLVFGRNIFNFDGTAIIKIIYREPRKAGVFA